ncbi:serine/threonine-protein kinase [Arthrobacter sp. 135MFCol5.1]|uniref:serine/threonine-protein kinase n=1 Tax=Arthrobacter sp. 135MFCol5.1 TaxID=1158050 RepID=UPI000477B865|nr:serine/threonine-protein kinase [Arthrobacter sp. 135MFCol5.1]
MELVGKHFVLINADQRIGGLSTVRRGVDSRDGSAVAVKFVAGGTDELSHKVFERETRALRNLSHPNIVKFRDAGIDDTGTYYLVLDWVDHSLVDLLKERPWEGWDDLYETIGKPLVDGLAHAHLKQFEHRDIKPANILIDSGGAPLLADFGIAKIRGDEQHSELTVRNFRSGPYAPPELDAAIPYVRDVYSVGVVLLQCLSESAIRDFPDVKRALESVDVPRDVHALLEACVSPEPTERPANGSVLASEFKKLANQRIARQQQPRNPIWLDLTRTAQEHLAGEPIDKERAAARLQSDLAGEVFASFGLNRETGKRDPNVVFLVGSEHRYTLRPDYSRSCFTVTAAPALELEALEGGRRHGLALPPIFSWTVRQPVNPAPSEHARTTLIHLIDDFYDRRDHSSNELSEQTGDELFDLWLRVLDAREALARGENKPLSYKKVRVEGRRGVFTLTEACEVELVGTDWEVTDQHSGKKFGHGEVIDQDVDQITVLSPRPLIGVPGTATLVPYDRPSAISLNRQRNAVLAVKSGTTPSPDLRSVLVDPTSNAEPAVAEIAECDLDPVKKRAVQLALGAKDVLVIQGPPGTGKTRFITETVTQFLKQQPAARVLIASQTHVAVDNAVERLHKAGIKGLVRLAGADESVVEVSVRDLLLDTQTRRWAEGVRSRAEANVSNFAAGLGIDANHLRAALTLEQLAAVSRELEAVEQHVAVLVAASSQDQSDLATAIEDENPAERFQARLDQLNDRRIELATAAQRHLSGELTIPTNIGSIEARHAVDVLLGDSAQAHELLKRIELQAAWLEAIGAEDSLTSIFLSGTSVVAGTCTGFLRNKAVGQLEFDLCIVDEASKATLTEALVPMSRAKRWILVGDTRQLPPTDEDLLRSKNLLNEHDLTKDNVTETLFQRLVDYLPRHSQLTLEEQYRMIRPIGDLISTCFYDGQLRSPRTSGISGYDEVVGRAVTWIDTSPLGENRRESGTTSFANRAEAQILVSHLDTLEHAVDFGLIKVPDNKQQLEVLVIAPYKRQVEELRRKLAPKSFRNLAITVMSVDAVQGRESDLALLSLTRSNQKGKLGFLGADYWRRINVALSRARYGLTIVGDAGFIRETNGALRTVLEYIEKNPADCTVRAAEHD